MSGVEERGFAYVRRPEAEALKALKPSAAKVLIAIRCEHAEGKPFACGSRDFKEWGVGRDAAAAALGALVRAGVLAIVKMGARTGRGHRTIYEIVHKRGYVKEKAGKPANLDTEKAGKPAIKGRKTRQLDEKKAGFPDTPKETPPTTSSESEEGGVSVEREASQRSLRESMQRIEQAATAVAMTDRCFIEKGGGLQSADFLARSYESGNLTALQLRAKLAEKPAGLAEGTDGGPTVFAVAIGGAS